MLIFLTYQTTQQTLERGVKHATFDDIVISFQRASKLRAIVT